MIFYKKKQATVVTPEEQARKTVEWLASPEGIRVLEQYLRAADCERERAARLRRVNPLEMLERVD